MIEINSKIGIVCCSNGQSKNYEDKINKLLNKIREIGYEPVCSDYIYEADSYFSASGEDRAKALLKFYENDDIKAIFDISGGDIANELWKWKNNSF